MIPFPLLSAIVFWPLLGGFFSLAFGRYPQQCRWVGLGVALGDLFLVMALWFLVLPADSQQGWLLAEDLAWIDRFGIRYSLAVDGISLVLLLLTAFLGVLVVLVSWRQVTDRVGAFHFLLFATQTAILGVFLATDLFLFYLFWEMQLVPMFFLIGIWGHEKRLAATIKFFLFSITGGLLFLLAVIGLYLVHGAQTGDYTFAVAQLLGTHLSPRLETVLFAAFLLAFAIKIPIIPVHTWLPDAHTEAPTAGSVLLAGLLLKTGAYAVLRLGFPLFPTAAKYSASFLAVLGLVGIYYAAWIALAQKDMKRLVAYSSIGHMGLVVLGLAVWDSITLSGTVLQMVNHGLTTAALFILVGMLDERAQSRALADFGGLWKTMPVFSAFFLLFGMASLGLPGLNNFVSEILIVIGTFRAWPLVGAFAFGGIVLSLVYVLKLIQDTLFGEARKGQRFQDITTREAIILVPLAMAVLALGLYPGPILDILEAPVHHLLEQAAKVAAARVM
jgi:NADH-quinone oxidoreductase subunit M